MKNILIILISLTCIRCTYYNNKISIQCLNSSSNRAESLIDKYKYLYYEEPPYIGYDLKIMNSYKDTVCLQIPPHFNENLDVLLKGGFYAIYEKDSIRLKISYQPSVTTIVPMKSFYISLSTDLYELNTKAENYTKEELFDYMREFAKHSKVIYIPNEVPDFIKEPNCKCINNEKLQISKHKNYKVTFASDNLD